MNFMIALPMVTALTFATSAEHGIVGRIFNGQNAERDQFKYMAAVITYINNPLPKKVMCGGTIIGLNWVLTAAHCVGGKEKASILLGALHRREPEISYEVQDIILHPKWSSRSRRNDIALIRIPRTEECEYIAFARMPTQWRNRPLNAFTDMMVIAIGWGQLGDKGRLPSCLQWAQMKVISNEECNTSFGDIRSKDLCATTRAPYGSTCTGDSGGPLVLKDTGELIGVTSTIFHKGCENGDPVVFVRLTSYLSWIAKVTGISL